MKLKIIAVGNKMPAWISAGFDEFAKRMPPEARMVLTEVKPDARASGKTPAQMMAQEARRIQEHLSGARVVVLDERGADLTTIALKDRLGAWMQEGRDVAFVIGGADGLDPALKRTADETMRISALTLPHGMVRVVLAEALYRAVSLKNGHPYHRE